MIKKNALLFLIQCLLIQVSITQPIKRTNNWYFGDSAGVNFNSGIPVPLHDGILTSGGMRGQITMSDTNGNLLFYTAGWTIWNRNHDPIKNFFMPEAIQFISFPVIGSDHLYYIFGVPQYGPPQTYYKTQYAIIDMSMNGGLGGVSGNSIYLDAAWDAAGRIVAAKHKNKQDVWVITRKYTDNKYASFLVNQNGVNTSPVLSPAPELAFSIASISGQMKISYDKKYLINCCIGDVSHENGWTEVCKFNDISGEVDYLYSFDFIDPNYPDEFNPYGVEFSPDSKFLYISFQSVANSSYIYQLDVQLIEDSTLFVQSAYQIGFSKYNYGLQLASDGKIYVAQWGNPGNPYIGVIHKPWKQGVDCQHDSTAVFLDPGVCQANLPSYLLDDLYRFDFEGICEGEPFQFTNFFHPEPVTILWDFGDPASGSNTSGELNPVHAFSDGGSFEVSVHVEYPSGRIEETSRKVEVEYAPEPDLGPDTTICTGLEVILDAECGPHAYSWSTGTFGVSQITVSDTGWYWVRVISDPGCVGIDSIYVGFRHPSTADTTNLVVSPTTCGGSTGAIQGLVIIGDPPFTLQWLDDMGNPISSSINIYNLPVGTYTLQVTDSNNCITDIGPYSIIDAGDVLIDDVEYSSEHCNQQDGSITITATSGLSDMLFYSIDNGATYYANQGIFTGLTPGSYAVRVKDSSNCQDVFINNPIIIENLPGPQLSNVLVTPCIIGQNNGIIEIIASGSSDTLYYSNNNGTTYQVNDSVFSFLAAGFYSCVVMDEYGCDTTFIVEVPEEITIRLQAVAGDDEVCPGNSAFVPLVVSNFNDVGKFKTTLLYNKDLITCQGFANAHPQIEDSLEVMLFPAEGKVELNWSSAGVTLVDNTSMADLVFQSIDPGLSFVQWDGSPGASFFQNSTGVIIPVDFFTGTVKIYNNISFSLNGTTEGCKGDTLKLLPMVWTSNGIVTYSWTDPGGNTSSGDLLTINNLQATQAGEYYLIITDTLGCYADTTFEIILLPDPVTTFAGQDTIITEEPVELDAGDNYVSYVWSTGETDQYITADHNDWYSVVIESALGCFGEDSVYVLFFTPEPIEPELYLPNAFTPDGDGLNDEFKVINPPDNIASFKMYIFNRWGQIVFESSDISLGWDGTFKNQAAPAGTYVFRLEYSIDAYDFDTKGTVVLVR